MILKTLRMIDILKMSCMCNFFVEHCFLKLCGNKPILFLLTWSRIPWPFFMILKTLGIVDILKMSCMHNVLKSIVISSFVAINIFCFWSHNVVLRDLLRPLKLPRGILITIKNINTLLKIQVSTSIKQAACLLANHDNTN